MAAALGFGAAAIAAALTNGLHVTRENNLTQQQSQQYGEATPTLPDGSLQNPPDTTDADGESHTYLQSAGEIPGWIAGVGVGFGAIFGLTGMAWFGTVEYRPRWAQQAATKKLNKNQ